MDLNYIDPRATVLNYCFKYKRNKKLKRKKREKKEKKQTEPKMGARHCRLQRMVMEAERC